MSSDANSSSTRNNKEKEEAREAEGAKEAQELQETGKVSTPEKGTPSQEPKFIVPDKDGTTKAY